MNITSTLQYNFVLAERGYPRLLYYRTVVIPHDTTQYQQPPPENPVITMTIQLESSYWYLRLLSQLALFSSSSSSFSLPHPPGVRISFPPPCTPSSPPPSSSIPSSSLSYPPYLCQLVESTESGLAENPSWSIGLLHLDLPVESNPLLDLDDPPNSTFVSSNGEPFHPSSLSAGALLIPDPDDQLLPDPAPAG